MLIKLVNPSNLEQISMFGEISDFKISTNMASANDIEMKKEELFEKIRKNTSDVFYNEDSNRPIIKLTFTFHNTKEVCEIYTNWNIYLMNSDGQTIESL